LLNGVIYTYLYIFILMGIILLSQFTGLFLVPGE
jgi:hypothetical protein